MINAIPFKSHLECRFVHSKENYLNKYKEDKKNRA